MKMSDFNNSNLKNEFSMIKIIEFTDGDEQLIKDTINLLIETLNEDIMLLKSLTSPLQIDLIKKVSHKIKPNFDLIGLKSLFELSNTLENDQLSEIEYKDLIYFIYNSKSIVLELLMDKLNSLTNLN